MKEVFYGLLCFIIVSSFVYIYKTDRLTSIKKYQDCIIVDIGNDYLLGKYINIMFPSNKVETVLIYEYAIINYNVGDTIK